MSTSMSVSVVSKRVYRSFVVYIGDMDTLVDLIKFDMFDFDFDLILGIDWLQSCYASLDCWTWRVSFQ